MLRSDGRQKYYHLNILVMKIIQNAIKHRNDKNKVSVFKYIATSLKLL
jgi:hypothetical protein